MNHSIFFKEVFAWTLRNLFRNTGKQQRDLAKYLNVSEATISRYVNAARLPDIETAFKMCRFFNITLNELLPLNKR